MKVERAFALALVVALVGCANNECRDEGKVVIAQSRVLIETQHPGDYGKKLADDWESGKASVPLEEAVVLKNASSDARLLVLPGTYGLRDSGKGFVGPFGEPGGPQLCEFEFRDGRVWLSFDPGRYVPVIDSGTGVVFFMDSTKLAPVNKSARKQ